MEPPSGGHPINQPSATEGIASSTNGMAIDGGDS